MQKANTKEELHNDDLSTILMLLKRLAPDIAIPLGQAYKEKEQESICVDVKNIESGYQLLNDFLEDCAIRGLQPRVLETYKGCVKEFLIYFPDPAKVTQRDLKSFLQILQGRQLKVSTQKRVFSALNTFYRYLIFEEIATSNPVEPFRERFLNMKEYDSESRRLITVDEVIKILKMMPSILDYALIFTLAKTGLRKGELLDMEVQDIDLKKRILYIPHKAKRSRNIAFIDDELEEVLKIYLEWRSTLRTRTLKLFVTKSGFGIHKDYINRVIGEAAGKLGIHNQSGLLHEKVTAHCFRHFFTTYLHRAGMNEEYIKWLRGDAFREAWQIYNHIDEESVRREYYACIPSLLVVPDSLQLPRITRYNLIKPNA